MGVKFDSQILLCVKKMTLCNYGNEISSTSVQSVFHSCRWVFLSQETVPVINAPIPAAISALHFAEFSDLTNTQLTTHTYTQIQNYTIYTNTQTLKNPCTQILGCRLSMPLSPLPSLHFVEFHNKSSPASLSPTHSAYFVAFSVSIAFPKILFPKH